MVQGLVDMLVGDNLVIRFKGMVMRFADQVTKGWGM